MHSGLQHQETSLAVSGAAGTARLLSQLPFPWLIIPCEPPGATGALCKPSVDQLLPGAEKLGAPAIALLTPVTAHALPECWKCLILSETAQIRSLFPSPSPQGKEFNAASGGFPGFPGCLIRVMAQITGLQFVLFVVNRTFVIPQANRV